MASKPKSAAIIDRTSTKSLLEIQNALFNLAQIESHDCPWIAFGNLYCSVSVTGEESWKPLVTTLAALGKVNFHILSGRHGRHAGGFTDAGTMDPADKDADILAQDKKNAIGLLAKNKNITIDVIDTPTVAGDIAKFKAKIETLTAHGNVVIVGWCNSVSCLYQFPTGNKATEAAKALGIYNKQVAVVDQEMFTWSKNS